VGRPGGVCVRERRGRQRPRDGGDQAGERQSQRHAGDDLVDDDSSRPITPAAARVSVHPVAQGYRVDPQVPGYLRDRLAGLADQPDGALPEISIELPAYLCHRPSL
jgi:hypothetical protein